MKKKLTEMSFEEYKKHMERQEDKQIKKKERYSLKGFAFSKKYKGHLK